MSFEIELDTWITTDRNTELYLKNQEYGLCPFCNKKEEVSYHGKCSGDDIMYCAKCDKNFYQEKVV